jgi:hypothetical protein
VSWDGKNRDALVIEREIVTGELAQVTGEISAERRVKAPEAGTLTGAPKNPNRPFGCLYSRACVRRLTAAPDCRFRRSVAPGGPLSNLGSPERLSSKKGLEADTKKRRFYERVFIACRNNDLCRHSLLTDAQPR